MTIGLQKLHKVLNYPIIKPEDGGVLEFFVLFLTGCLNAMFGVMEDLDNATTTKALVNKLYCELQEIWRKAASGLQEKSKISMKKSLTTSKLGICFTQFMVTEVKHLPARGTEHSRNYDQQVQKPVMYLLHGFPLKNGVWK